MNNGDIVKINEAGKQAFYHERGIRPTDLGVVLRADKRTATVRPLELPFAEVLRREEIEEYAQRGRIEGLI